MGKKLKAGMPPGTMVYSGQPQSENVFITVIEFNENEIVETSYSDFDPSFLEISPSSVKWINIDGIHNVEIVEKIGKLFNIHPLTLEDIVHVDQRPKFEDYEEYVFATMKMVYYSEGIMAEQLSIILKENIVISFQEVHGIDTFDIIRQRLQQSKGKIRRLGADYLAYALLDAIVDSYFAIIEKIGDKVEILEEELINKPSPNTLKKIHELKRELIFLRKSAWPQRDLISNMERCETMLIKPSTDVYLRDVHDHAIRVIDTVETFRDLLSGMMDIYLSSVSNKMNEVMKVLTIISTIFIPVTFIAGVYGMNFHNIPELQTTWGYTAVWIVMILIMLAMVYFFKRKKWL